jgi:hypothetical protein
MTPTRYRLVVKGELGPRYASAFDAMTLHAHDGQTDITGPVIDQAHLQELIERVADLGLTLRSVNPLEAGDGEADAQPHTPPAGIDYHNPGAFEGTVKA